MDLSLSSLISAAETGTSLRLVQRFFAEGLDLGTAMPWAIGLGSIVIVLSAAILIINVLHRRRPYVPQDWITDPKEIRSVFERALDQRSKFELQFSPGQGGRRPALRCIAARVEGRFLVLEAIGLKTLSDRWVGREMDCFFQIVHRGNALHHAFKSSLESIRVINDYCFIRIFIPERLESRQKRSYLRIVPPDEYLLGAAIWHGEQMPPPKDHENLSAWPRPSLAYLPAVTRQIMVRDLSAGGARVHIPKDCLGNSAPHLTTGARILFMLDLWDPDKTKRMRCWMLCRVQNPVLDFETQGMDLGLQFLAWARPRETGEGGALEWLRLSRSGEIEALGNWIMRRHLELFRESEADINSGLDAAASPPQDFPKQ